LQTAYDPAPAAALLADAWRHGKQLRELPADCRPATLQQGYDLQDSLFAAMGGPLAGWKLGVGSPAAMRAGGLDRPLVGRLLQSRCWRDGETVQLSNGAPVTVEFEIALVLGRDIAPGQAPDDPMEAVAGVHTAFELVLSRFVDRRAVGWPSFAGDSVGFDAFVLGQAITLADIDRVIETVRVEVDGVEHARGLAGDDLSYPSVALRYLFDHARERGVTLRRGEIVSAGTVAKPFDVAARGVTLTARYHGGELRAHLQ
jgi:2-keto-4-pentenoate hydratase